MGRNLSTAPVLPCFLLPAPTHPHQPTFLQPLGSYEDPTAGIRRTVCTGVKSLKWMESLRIRIWAYN